MKLSKIWYLISIALFFITIFVFLDRYFFQTMNYEELRNLREKTLINLKEDEPIKIGVVWSFTIKEESGNDYFKEGILLAVGELNQKKVLNREIEVVFQDNHYDSKTSIEIARDFANDPKIVAVISDYSSNLATPNSIIYEHAGVIMISPAVSEPNFTKVAFDYIFRNTPNDIDIGRRLAGVSAMKNFKKIVILNDNSQYGEALSKVFREEVVGLGSKVIYSAKFSEKTKDFKKFLTDISPIINTNIDYDAIFVAGDEYNIPFLIKQAREYGIYAPFIAGDFLDTTNILKQGKEMDGTIVATIFNNELLNEKTQDFIDRFKQTYQVNPDTWAAQGYDAVMLLAKAIEKTKSLNTQKIASTLKYMKNYESIFGRYSLNKKGDVEDREIHFKVVKNGKFHYLYLR